MKILFIGDIFGRLGRGTIKKVLPSVRKENEIDFVIANGENMSHGSGFTSGHVAELQEAGIDFFTTGNHFPSKKEGVEKLSDKSFPVIRPANYPPLPEIPGDGYRIIETNNKKRILIINLMGRVFMKKDLDCPFRKADEVLEETKDEKLDAIIVDFHAETTSEKQALAFYLDGRVSGFFGTHTHVPTADARILEKGTGYITDAGMTGAINSVIGVEKELIIKSFLTQLKAHHKPENEGVSVFNSVMIDIDDSTKISKDIVQIQKYI